MPDYKTRQNHECTISEQILSKPQKKPVQLADEIDDDLVLVQDLESALKNFFVQIAQKQTDLLENIKNNPNFEITDSRWCFSLPMLHTHLQLENELFSSIEYKQLRRLLFDNPINQAIKQYGAKIIIHSNQNKVDNSIYALVWC